MPIGRATFGELENFIERCVIFTQGDELNVLTCRAEEALASAASAAPSFEQAERQAIIDALKAASGRIAGKGGAAERLGLKRTTLQNKMRKLNISRADVFRVRHPAVLETAIAHLRSS